LSEKKIAI